MKRMDMSPYLGGLRPTGRRPMDMRPSTGYWEYGWSALMTKVAIRQATSISISTHAVGLAAASAIPPRHFHAEATQEAGMLLPFKRLYVRDEQGFYYA
jgi:hypothetical protein